MLNQEVPELLNSKNYSHTIAFPGLLQIILLVGLASLMSGCSTDQTSDNYHQRGGIWGEHDAYLGAMQEGRTTSSTSDVYLAPGTTMEIIRTRPVLTRPVYTIYDRRNNIYIGVGPDGKGYILNRPWDGVPILERDITRYSAPHDRSGRIHTEKHAHESGYSVIIGSPRQSNRQGVTTWPKHNQTHYRRDRHDGRNGHEDGDDNHNRHDRDHDRKDR